MVRVPLRGADGVVGEVRSRCAWRDGVGAGDRGDRRGGREALGEGVAVDRATQGSGEGWVGGVVGPGGVGRGQGEGGLIDREGGGDGLGG